MAFLDNESEGGPPNRIKLLSMFIGLWVIGFAIKYATTGNIFGASRHWTPDRVEAELMGDPQGRELYQAIRDSYPADYQSLLGRLTTLAASGTRDDRAQEMGRFARQLMTDHFDGLARAPSDQLVEIDRQYVRLIETLQRLDTIACAQVLDTGVNQTMQLPPEAEAMLNRIVILQIRASRAGEMQQRAVPRTEPSAEERAALVAETGRRSPDAQRLLKNPDAAHLAPVRQQCAAGLVLYQAIEGLPPKLSARMVVSLARLAYRQPAPPVLGNAQ